MSPNDTASPVWRMRWLDALWVLTYPIYQTLGTIRHEGSHALAGAAEGATITKFVIYPQHDLGRFTWGYTEWTGSTGWFTDAAPYLCDLIWFVGFFLIVTRLRIPNHPLWINLVIFGLISPLLNSGVQWIAGFTSPVTDVGKLRTELPDALVQIYFLLTLALYVVGLVAVFLRVPRRLLLPDPAPAPA
jgi:Peptidase M50B-like